ncbi:YwqJ-related putative deaminase [Streptomyces albiaxialis]|uniref:YwqJ-related putative deaminase n=1 Tax=Streptomyces albiaxialis TaxID=329523 RepID=A0ABN2VER8_9ACTN
MHTAQQAHTPQSRGHHDPRIGWTTADDTATTAAPALRQRRDSILPAVAAALSIRGQTLTCTGSRGDRPPTLHPLVQDFLDTLTTDRRVRQTGRCPEAVLLSRYLTATETARSTKRAVRKPTRSGSKPGKNTKPPKPLTLSEAKRALKHAKLTARRIREDGDPLHGTYAPPCRSCAEMLAHFGVRAVDPAEEHAK